MCVSIARAWAGKLSNIFAQFGQKPKMLWFLPVGHSSGARQSLIGGMESAFAQIGQPESV